MLKLPPCVMASKKPQCLYNWKIFVSLTEIIILMKLRKFKF